MKVAFHNSSFCLHPFFVQGIRITPNVYTTLSELDRFCQEMETIAKNGPPA